MSRSTWRRPRGTKTVQLHMLVTPDVKETIDRYAAAAEAPTWAIVEAAIKASTPGPNGYPADWDLPAPPPKIEDADDEGGTAAA